MLHELRLFLLTVLEQHFYPLLPGTYPPYLEVKVVWLPNLGFLLWTTVEENMRYIATLESRGSGEKDKKACGVRQGNR